MMPLHNMDSNMEMDADQAKAKVRQTAFQLSDTELRAHINVVTQDILALEKLAQSLVYLNVPESLSSFIILSKELLDTLTNVWVDQPRQKKHKAA